MAFQGSPRQGKKLLQDGLDRLSYLACSTNSHHEISISCIFLEFPHQVDMKTVVKCWKDFLRYSTTIETYRDCTYVLLEISKVNKYIFGTSRLCETDNFANISCFQLRHQSFMHVKRRRSFIIAVVTKCHLDEGI